MTGICNPNEEESYHYISTYASWSHCIALRQAIRMILNPIEGIRLIDEIGILCRGCHDGGLVLHTLHYLIGSYSTANEEAACGDLGQDCLGGLSDLLRRECLANLLCQSADHDHGTGVL